MQLAPALFLPAPIRMLGRHHSASLHSSAFRDFSFADLRVTPHYPASNPLDEVLRQVMPGGDEYLTEKYAFEILAGLGEWSKVLKMSASALGGVLGKFIDPAVKATPIMKSEQTAVRSKYGIDVRRRKFSTELLSGREAFLDQLSRYRSDFSSLDTAEFEITAIEQTKDSPLTVNAELRYEFLGALKIGGREQRIGYWKTQWMHAESEVWKLTNCEATGETVSRAGAPHFIDVASQAFGPIESYKTQLLRGNDYWRTVLDGACGIDVYGNNGIAVGDFNNDGFDDIYICQPAGLPNRLYRNNGDGAFADVTKQAGVDVLDSSSCALFADFENKGLQDLLVVCEGGPLLFLNQGNGKFELKRDAFKFARAPQGTFTHAAIADYDRDGRLDVYFCLYNYYLGLDQYHYPAPYFDARNGPPNFLFHNEGNAAFEDRTEATGLNIDNDRYSFACAWGDYNSNGLPDLYVANDFGRNNLYRNHGDGTFTSVSAEAGVEDVGAGMSACWFDFDGDGHQDIYAGNMWSSAGMRVSDQKSFHEEDPESIRALYHRHARGNSLYQNQGNGRFKNVSTPSGAEIGRWAWSCDAWDFDHDGHPDLYIANGYVSGPDFPDLASFFWRQLVAKSPQNSSPSPNYEHGWNAINELIRSDGRWSGYERNIAYLNNGDGTFSNVSGVVGLDFVDDSRSFALADLDHDGRLEVVLKNRTAPQLRILRNVMSEIGNSLSFRLHGTKSNRDAIGAAVTVEAGERRQTKYLQAGSGFLSQHSKELLFGVSDFAGAVSASILWPSGLIQQFPQLPVNVRIEIHEGSNEFIAQPHSRSLWSHRTTDILENIEPLPSSCETWLIEPLAAPDFSLPDAAGRTWQLRSLLGSFVLLNFCANNSESSRDQLKLLQNNYATHSSLRIIAVNVDEADQSASHPLAQQLPFPVLTASEETVGVYNIIYRYLFDRRRDLPLPASFLIDDHGNIVKLYQGLVQPDQVLKDLQSVPQTREDRMRKALPFPGKLYQSDFQRNAFTYGVAFFHRGYLDQAAESFQQAIAAKPTDAEAYYNLGTLYLRRNDRQLARQNLEQAVALRPNHPEAWNNLGMLSAQEGDPGQAVRDFKQSLTLKPNYVIAMVNLANLYRRQHSFDDAEKLLQRALQLEPDDPEVNYSAGMLSAQQDQIPQAEQYLQKAVRLRPDYPDALNNLGVLFVREQHYPEAENQFKTCIAAAPKYDQAYMNLARLYVILDRKSEAREILQALLRQQPQHKLAQQALEMLQ
ncbi:MAG: FG-GAP-like repeat-containing protein [Terriglobales bacterium]